MSDRLKSAYELTMERLKAKGGAGGERQLSNEQRARIAAVRKEFQAKRAEAEVLHQSAVDKARAANDPQKLLALERERQQELAELDQREEAQVQEVRGG